MTSATGSVAKPISVPVAPSTVRSPLIATSDNAPRVLNLANPSGLTTRTSRTVSDPSVSATANVVPVTVRSPPTVATWLR